MIFAELHCKLIFLLINEYLCADPGRMGGGILAHQTDVTILQDPYRNCTMKGFCGLKLRQCAI